jgi:hypothetical protein
VACDDLFSGFQQCWTYDIGSNSWNSIAASSFEHGYPGVLYNNRIYALDDEHPEIYDPETGLWTDWPAPVLTQPGACALVWKNNFVVLGGNINTTGVLVFDLSSETWKTVESNDVPFQLVLSGYL